MNNINSIIESIKNGNQESFTILLNGNKGLIYKVINLLNLDKGDFRIDEESLFQEGSIALYDSVFSYDANKGMSFTSYAYMIIHSRIISYIRKIKKFYENEVYSFDAHSNVEYISAFKSEKVFDNPEMNIRINEYYKFLIDFYNRLSNEDKTLLQMRKDNYSYKEISEKTGIEMKRIDNRLSSVRRKLKTHLDNEYYLPYIESFYTKTVNSTIN